MSKTISQIPANCVRDYEESKQGLRKEQLRQSVRGGEFSPRTSGKRRGVGIRIGREHRVEKGSMSIPGRGAVCAKALRL